ncbi:ATP-dependent DNA helicase RecQ [Neolewinella lacunae]|uniref:ATP-dependent DNA helicase RecQ n=1 Tax=Neolewinella lacunae TaxID=1517758 RepID=A0A923PPY1_9BACT|nr:ATP-dependent DNA helicase RecQ [Neolewinella lacunae]MBC6996410.1 ATP-dependent DNA helicase RecQ [Neolewinella lacunae]MDN3633647.1 ATP-dependent DNA helicase RecQ [Neolewinella lacunae]
MTAKPVGSHLEKALLERFGFDQFKGNQKAIIESLFDGKDTFVIMPTGGGKSLCYQLPGLMMDGCALVISPLIALMKNQVDSIRAHGESDAIAHFLNSSLSKSQMRQVKDDISSGETKLLFVAPETLTKEENIEFFREANISFVAIDEAHCISEWGHDFRPEYRRIREMLDQIGHDIPIIALTATATPKVQSDIVKNLRMGEDHNTFVSSFNRDNLYYEVRPKGKKEYTIKQIIQVVKEIPGKSGIIYVQSRKAAEEIAEALRVNDVKAAPYHAGLDPKTRSKTQDDFLMEEVDVICATIAFGMGIDKPDVRFVIHYDIPKSIENYYQETGRAGRDGMDGRCVAFYAYRDILKLEKFLRDKPLMEREMGAQLMQEVMAYSETTACRRRFLLHYFGEEYAEADCNKMCDNCRHPKKRIEVKDKLVHALSAVRELDQNYPLKTLIEFVLGKETKQMKDYKFTARKGFGVGKGEEEVLWSSIFRQALLNNLVRKDIESYGLIKLTEAGEAFLKKPVSFQIPIDHDFEKELADDIRSAADDARAVVLDEVLLLALKDLRKKEAKRLGIPPFVIFQDPSLLEMATRYPITMDEMKNINGVSIGKARRYATPFLTLIEEHVEENDIDRPLDFVVKQVANKSKKKVNIIQGVDRKLPLEDIASGNQLTMDELLEEMVVIVLSGTKLNIDYYIEDAVDEYSLEETYEYFMRAETDDPDIAFQKLKEEDVTIDEIKLVRIKFLSEMAN